MADESSNHSPKLACFGPTTPKQIGTREVRRGSMSALRAAAAASDNAHLCSVVFVWTACADQRAEHRATILALERAGGQGNRWIRCRVRTPRPGRATASRSVPKGSPYDRGRAADHRIP